MTRSFFRQAMACALVAFGFAASGLSAAGNGAFLHQYRGGPFGGNKGASAQFEIYCNQGFTCGYANVEVDWDDGSAIDSIVGNVPPVNSSGTPLEEEFIHYYAQNGLYHVHLSIDDNMGNWWNMIDDYYITS
jgi:hypothetical protein